VTAAEVLALARARGVTIKPDGDELDILADRQPDPDLLAAIAGCKGAILAQLRAERGRVDRWIRDRLTAASPDRCWHCRKPIVVGQKFVDVRGNEVVVRFHAQCESEWRRAQEALARKAMGLTGETSR
jgi:hypothetical protein